MLNQKEAAGDCREDQVNSQLYPCLSDLQDANCWMGNEYRIHLDAIKYKAVFRPLSEAATDPELSPCFLYYPACQQPCAVSWITAQVTFVTDVSTLLSASVQYKILVLMQLHNGNAIVQEIEKLH